MSCNTDSQINKIWKYQLDNGNTGKMVISDPLLDTEPRARERAMSEFLKNGYTLIVINFKTYRTDLLLNETINVGGVLYLVKRLSYDIDPLKLVTTVKAVRYE